MARKRKLEAAPGLDEADRTLYSAFRDAASFVSRLYSQAMAQQGHASRAGELHALEKLSEWILRRRAEDPTLTVADIVAHIQCEMEYGGGRDAQAAPRSAHWQPARGGRSGEDGPVSSDDTTAMDVASWNHACVVARQRSNTIRIDAQTAYYLFWVT